MAKIGKKKVAKRKAVITRSASNGRFLFIGDKKVRVGGNSIKNQPAKGDLQQRLRELQEMSEEISKRADNPEDQEYGHAQETV